MEGGGGEQIVQQILKITLILLYNIQNIIYWSCYNNYVTNPYKSILIIIGIDLVSILFKFFKSEIYNYINFYPSTKFTYK